MYTGKYHVDEPEVKKRSLLADTEEIDETNTNVQLKLYRQRKEAVKKHKDPILLGEKNQNKFPAVASLAMKYSSVVATSVPSKRLFSQAGLY